MSFEPFASDREKRLAYFAQEVLHAASESGFDMEIETITNIAEQAGLIYWEDCTEANRDEWPEECEEGDRMWRIKRGSLPGGVIKLESSVRT